MKLTSRPPRSGPSLSHDGAVTLPSPDHRPLLPRCPACRRELVWQGDPHRPFCSLTCRLIDLGIWLDEGYRIAATEESPPTEASRES